jgi:hypothetical protein
MLKDDSKLAQCMRLVADQSGLGDPRKWTKRDYEQLSFLIEQRSRIILSVSTLIRHTGLQPVPLYIRNDRLAHDGVLQVLHGAHSR